MSSRQPGCDPQRAPLSAADQQLLAAQRRLISFAPYYSAVMFIPTIVGGVATIKAGTTLKAFSFAEGKEAVSAGFPSATFGNATFVETNLQESGKTIGGQNVEVTGIAIQPFPGSDPLLLKALWTNVHARVQFNGGNDNFELGPLHHVPGGGGLYGMGRSPLGGADFSGNQRPIDFATNGLPGRDNCLSVREGFTWSDKGADSNMNILFSVVRDIVITSPAAFVGQAPAVATQFPAQAYVQPVAYTGVQGSNDIYAMLSIRLVGNVVGPRSNIQ